MDGARFANALVSLGCSPADMTWKQGVDILSFGATKNGCLMAEAIVVFNQVSGREPWITARKRAGQIISKGRLIAAQFRGLFRQRSLARQCPPREPHGGAPVGWAAGSARRAPGLADRGQRGLPDHSTADPWTRRFEPRAQTTTLVDGRR